MNDNNTIVWEPLPEYEQKALIEAEQRGVIEYDVRGNCMSYLTHWPMEQKTYSVVINLNTMKERRKALDKYVCNRHTNLCV